MREAPNASNSAPLLKHSFELGFRAATPTELHHAAEMHVHADLRDEVIHRVISLRRHRPHRYTLPDNYPYDQLRRHWRILLCSTRRLPSERQRGLQHQALHNRRAPQPWIITRPALELRKTQVRQYVHDCGGLPPTAFTSASLKQGTYTHEMAPTSSPELARPRKGLATQRLRDPAPSDSRPFPLLPPPRGAFGRYIISPCQLR